MDEDLDRMTRDQLIDEAKKLRQGIRRHRDGSRHELCWYHPSLWGLLPERTDPVPVVPEWPEFMRGCVKYRQSLDEQAPNAPRTDEPYMEATPNPEETRRFSAGSDTQGGCMRKLVVLSFLTLDGVMQAPGGPEEDPAGGFQWGGWVFPYFDDFLGTVMDRQMNKAFDLLLGRRTYEIFAAYWPYVNTEGDPVAAGINRAKKYVASKTLNTVDWSNSELIGGDAAAEVKKLKEQEGPEIQVHGSGGLIQTLLKHDLVDELWLKIFPITLGRGKRLFAEGTVPAGFQLLESGISPNGVIVANYARAGEVRTGSFAPDSPTEAELARRKRLAAEDPTAY